MILSHRHCITCWTHAASMVIAVTLAFGSDATLADEAAVDEQQAVEVYERFLAALRRQPRPGTALDRVQAFHQERGTTAAFIESLTAAAVNDSTGVDLLIAGMMELQAGRNAEAVAVLQQAAAARAKDPMAAWLLAQSLMRVGRLTEAIAAYDRALMCEPSRTDYLLIARELARASVRTQQSEKAAAVWRDLETKFPGDMRVLEQMAAAMFEDGEFEAALEKFRRLAAEHPDEYQKSQHALMSARLLAQLDRSDEALATLDELLSRVDVDSWIASEARSVMEICFADDDDGLIAWLQARHDQHPDDIQTMRQLSRILRQRGNLTESRAWLDRALLRAPSNSSLRRELIDLLVRDDRIAEAIEQSAQLVGQSPGDSDAIEAWGRLWLQRTDLPPDVRRTEAAAVWRRLLDGAERDPLTVSRVGDLFSSAGMMDDALRLYESAVELAPDEPQYREYLGTTLLKLQRPEEARRAWREIASGSRRTPETLERLAEVLQRFGDHDESLSSLRAATELGPDLHRHLKLARQLTMRYEQLANEAIAATRSNTARARESDVAGEPTAGERDATRQDGGPGERVAGILELFDEALKQLERADQFVESDMERQTVLDQRLVTLIAAGQLESATQKLSTTLASDASEHETRERPPAQSESASDASRAIAARWAELSQYYAAAADLPSAIESINQSLRWDPTSVASMTLSARWLERAGRNAEAADANRRLVELDRRFQSDYLRKIADLEVKLGRHERALEAARELVASAPGNTEHAQFLAQLCFRAERADEGIETLRRCLRAQPSDTSTAIALARALADQSRPVEALELFWRAFEQSDSTDGRVAVVTQMATVADETGQFDQMVSRLERFGSSLEHQHDAAACLAAAYKTVGDLALARQKLELLLEAGGENMELLEQLAVLAEEEGDLDAALSYHRRLVSMDPTNARRSRLASLLMQSGDVAEAERLWAEATDYDGSRHEIFRSVDQLLLSESTDAARMILTTLLQREPNNWEALVRLGLLDWHAGRRDEALRSFDALLSLSLNDNEPTADNVYLATMGKARFTGSQWAADRLVNANQATLVDSAARLPGRIEAAARYAALLEPLDEDDLTAQANMSFYSGTPGFRSNAMTPMSVVTDHGDARAVCLAAFVEAGIQPNSAMAATALVVDPAPPADPALVIRHARDALLSAAVEHKTEAMDHFQAGASQNQALESLIAVGDDEAMLLSLIALTGDGLSASARQRAMNKGLGTVTRSPRDVAALISAFEFLVMRHPDWLRSTDPDSIVDACRRSGDETALQSLIDRLGRSDTQSAKVAAIQLSVLSKPASVDAAWREFETAFPPNVTVSEPAVFLLAGGSSGDGDQKWNQFPEANLELILDAAAETRNERILVEVVDWYFDYQLTRSARPGKSVPSLYAQSHILSMPSRLLAFDSETMARYVGEQLGELSSQQAGIAWYEERRQRMSGRDLAALELFRAAMVLPEDRDDQTALHLIRALEAMPEDVELRFSVADRCAAMGMAAEAMTLLEGVPESDPTLLKNRETRILILAENVNDLPRRQLAAERLYGMQLTSEESEELSAQLRALGFTEMADDVETRLDHPSRHAVSQRPEKQALVSQMLVARRNKDLATASQIARQILRRTATNQSASLFIRAESALSGLELSTPDLRRDALSVLQQAGKLEELIAHNEAQLQANPGSRHLLRAQVELLTAAGRESEVGQLRAQLVAGTGTPKSVLQIANDDWTASRREQALTVVLDMLSKSPSLPRAALDAWTPRFIEADRTFQLAGVLHTRITQGHAVPLGTCRQLIPHLIKADATAEARQLGVSLLNHVIDQTESDSELNSTMLVALGECDWTAPEVFPVLLRVVLAPEIRSSYREWPLWMSTEVLVEIGPLNDAPFIAGLTHQLQDASRRAEYVSAIERKRRERADWKSGDLLLCLSDMAAADTQSAQRRLQALSEQPELHLSDREVCLITREIVRGHPDLLNAAAPLLRRAISENPLETEPSPVQCLLTVAQLYHASGRQSDARDWLHECWRHARSATDAPSGSLDFRGEQIAAYFAELGFPLDAMRIYWSLPESSIQNRKVPGFAAHGFDSLVQMSSEVEDEVKAVDGETLLDDLTAESLVQLGYEPAIRMDMAIEDRSLDRMEIESAVLNAMPRTVSGATAERLADVLATRLHDPSADPSTIVAAVRLVLLSENEQAIYRLTEPLTEWIRRPLPELPESTISDLELLHREGWLIALAIIARDIHDQPGLEPLAELLHDRAIQAARRWSDKRWLMALLSERGRIRMELGDVVSAEAAWNEVLDLTLARPDDRAVHRSGTSPNSSTPSSATPAVDLKAELRRSLLKP